MSTYICPFEKEATSAHDQMRMDQPYVGLLLTTGEEMELKRSNVGCQQDEHLEDLQS